MKPENPMSHEESQKIENIINRLVGRHNVLCRIEKVFYENEIANEYFEKAHNEVIDSGNASLASMFVIAIENMTEDIQRDKSSDTIDSLYAKISFLESENRRLISKIESIKKIINITYGESNK